jgi:hypothetical protein
MIARAVGSSWQTILADLSLILFMVTASALANAPDGPLGTDAADPSQARPAYRPAPPPAPPPVLPAPRAEPVAVWRPAAGAPTLPQWLDDVARDPRLRLTVTVHFAPGGRDAALAQAARLDRAAGARGDTARIVVEPGLPAGTSAVVGYDGADANGTGSGTQLAGHGT